MAKEEKASAYERHQEAEEHRLYTHDDTDWIASWLNLKGDVTITITKRAQRNERLYGVHIRADDCGVDAEHVEDRYPQVTAVTTMFAREQLEEHAKDEETEG